MGTVILKNRSEVYRTLLVAITISMESVLKEKPAIFFDLVMKCRDKNYVMFRKSAEHLKNIGLLEEKIGSLGEVPNVIKEIVLASTKGEGLEMIMVSPYLNTDNKEPCPS